MYKGIWSERRMAQNEYCRNDYRRHHRQYNQKYFHCFAHLSLYQVFEFDIGMAVLTLLESLTTVRANSLLRTDVHTSEARGAVVADDGFLVL